MAKYDGKELAVGMATDRESVRRFRHPSEVLEPADQLALVSQLADVLTPVFLFISKGRLGGTMDMRAWVVLHETRVDLIGNESIDKFAARVGVNSKRVRVLIDEFRQLVPGYRAGGRKSADTVAKMRASQRLRKNAQTSALPHPPGKESFFEGVRRTGSAMTTSSTHE